MEIVAAPKSQLPIQLSAYYQKFRLFVRDVLELDNEPFHDELDDAISQDFDDSSAAYRMIKRFFAVFTYPRDHGKSTHLSIAFPLWKIAKNHNIRILQISRTSNVAESFLSAIISNIERNEKYKQWAKAIDEKNEGVIPRLKYKRKQTEDWSGNSITVERSDVSLKDPTICATGLFGQILSRRADLIILDDVVDQQNSMTELQRKKVIDWIETTVIPVLVPGGTLLYLGNTWHTDDVVSKFLKDPRFVVQKRIGAIISDAERQDLWQQWGSIMLNTLESTNERFTKAELFYNGHKQEMDKGVQVLWPQRYPYSRLYLDRLLNPYVFARMYQCDPSDRPDQVIKDEWIERALIKGKNLKFQDYPHDKNYLEISAAGMDLAITQEEAGDDSALLYLDLVRHGYDGVDDGDYIIRQIHRGKMTPKEQRLRAKLSWTNHGMQTVRVETVGYQAALAIDLSEDGVPVRSYHTGKEKFDPEMGVNTLALLMETGKLVIPSNPTDARTLALANQLANEMRAFPDGHTGDTLMALWFAYSEIRELLGTRVLTPKSYMDRIKETPLPPPKTPERVELNKQADLEMIREQERVRSNHSRLIEIFGQKDK